MARNGYIKYSLFSNLSVASECHQYAVILQQLVDLLAVINVVRKFTIDGYKSNSVYIPMHACLIRLLTDARLPSIDFLTV